MRLHRHSPTYKKKSWKARSEAHQRPIIRNVQTSFSDSDLEELEAQIIENAVDTTSSNTRKRMRRFLREDVQGKDINLALQVFSKNSRKEQALVARSTATIKGYGSRPEKDKKDNEEDYSKREKTFHDNHASVLSSGTKQQRPFDESE